MKESEFWRCTPKKLFALLEAHNRANSVEENEEKSSKPQKMTLEDLRSMQTCRK